MAGIYIHIPFCSKACHYCNFHFSTSLKLKNDFILALLKEIEITATVDTSSDPPAQRYLNNDVIETIYFGRGTPSLLSAEELKLILSKVKMHYELAPDAEITLEANPDDINTGKLQSWRVAG